MLGCCSNGSYFAGEPYGLNRTTSPTLREKMDAPVAAENPRSEKRPPKEESADAAFLIAHRETSGPRLIAGVICS